MPPSEETFPDLARCPTCGGLNAVDAAWCGQCNRRFRPTSGRMPEHAGERPSYVQALAGLLVGPDELPEGAMERVFRLDGESPSWLCAGCGAENELASTGCERCGRPFGDTVKKVVEQLAAENAERTERAAAETLGHLALAARAGPLALPLAAVAVLVALLKAAARAALRRGR